MSSKLEAIDLEPHLSKIAVVYLNRTGMSRKALRGACRNARSIAFDCECANTEVVSTPSDPTKSG